MIPPSQGTKTDCILTPLHWWMAGRLKVCCRGSLSCHIMLLSILVWWVSATQSSTCISVHNSIHQVKIFIGQSTTVSCITIGRRAKTEQQKKHEYSELKEKWIKIAIAWYEADSNILEYESMTWQGLRKCCKDAEDQCYQEKNQKIKIICQPCYNGSIAVTAFITSMQKSDGWHQLKKRQWQTMQLSRQIETFLLTTSGSRNMLIRLQVHVMGYLEQKAHQYTVCQTLVSVKAGQRDSLKGIQNCKCTGPIVLTIPGHKP